MEEESGGLPPGLYEQLVTAGLEEQLRAIDDRYVSRSALHQAEAPNRIALHLSRQIEKALDGVPEKDRVAVGVEVVRELLGRLEQIVDKATSSRPCFSQRVSRDPMTGTFPQEGPARISKRLLAKSFEVLGTDRGAHLVCCGVSQTASQSSLHNPPLPDELPSVLN